MSGMDIHEILKYLPHRYPFLLVDKVISYEKGKDIVALKNVSINEPFFSGHFPHHPVMPGVLIVEALAQLDDLTPEPQPEDGVTYATKIDKAEARIEKITLDRDGNPTGTAPLDG